MKPLKEHIKSRDGMWAGSVIDYGKSLQLIYFINFRCMHAILKFLYVDYCLTKNHDCHDYCQCICLCYESQWIINQECKFGWGFHTICTFISRNIHDYSIENQKNDDDTIIASQIIMIFMINWIIAHAIPMYIIQNQWFTEYRRSGYFRVV